MTATERGLKSESGKAPAREPEGEELPTDEIEVTRTPTPTDINIVLRCVTRNDVERFTKCFEDEEDAFREVVTEQMNERDEEGKSPLDVAAILGRTEMLREVLARGAEVNEATTKGYTSLHHAAAWGRVGCLQALVMGGGDIQLKTSHSERPREIALRYSQTECVDFLDWAEAKQILIQTVTSLQEIMADPEKIQGKLDRNEKNSTLALIKEKLEWVETTTEATTQDFILQKDTFQETVAPIIQKINEPPPEKPEKK